MNDSLNIVNTFLAAEQSIWFYLFIGLIGNLGHILGKFAKWEAEGKAVSWRDFIKTSKFRTALGLFLMIGGILILQSYGDLNLGTAFLAGYFCDSALRNGMKAFKIDRGV